MCVMPLSSSPSLDTFEGFKGHEHDTSVLQWAWNASSSCPAAGSAGALLGGMILHNFDRPKKSLARQASK